MNKDGKQKAQPVFWEGFILAGIAEKPLLESMGVIVGPYNPEKLVFLGCIVTNEALDKLDPYWGRFYWALEPGGVLLN